MTYLYTAVVSVYWDYWCLYKFSTVKFHFLNDIFVIVNETLT